MVQDENRELEKIPVVNNVFQQLETIVRRRGTFHFVYFTVEKKRFNLIMITFRYDIHSFTFSLKYGLYGYCITRFRRRLNFTLHEKSYTIKNPTSLLYFRYLYPFPLPLGECLHFIFRMW